jgi:ABC-type phosphate/phosphonate transport system substrate-binding protein
MPALLAGLPMYDLPEVRAATDAWWRGLARAFRRLGIADVPERLSRNIARERMWRAPRLLFSQTCGFPFTHAFAGQLELVATPCYGAAGCGGPDYLSLIVVREDEPARALVELRGRVVAINGPGSHSGCSILRAMAAPLAGGRRFFGRTVVTGSHRASIAAVARGAADLAAIDCVLYALLERHAPHALAGVRVLTRSPPAPGLPYVTHTSQPADMLERVRAGLFEALADPSLAGCRDALLITGAEALPRSAYDCMRMWAGQARLRAGRAA